MLRLFGIGPKSPAHRRAGPTRSGCYRWPGSASPTGTFLAISGPVGLPITAIGMIILIWYRRNRRRKTRHDIRYPKAA